MEAPNFMETPLATWVTTFASVGDVIGYDELVDGTFIHFVMGQIDPRAKAEHVNLKCEDIKDRCQNWDIIMRNIRVYYQDVLQMYIVMKPPDMQTITKEPHSLQTHSELSKVLLMLLGCAVQCESKETFIENIKSLELEVQHAMVEFIQEITDDSRNVYSMDLPTEAETSPHCKILHKHLKQLLKQRDSYVEEMRDLVQTSDNLQTQVDSQEKSVSGVSGGTRAGPSPATVSGEKHHLGVEVAELKGRVRRLRQELEEKNELCQELKDEFDEQNALLTKLRNENLSLTQDARAARTYRDEIDVLNQKAARADKLEGENVKYKEKLNELDFYKARVEELRDDNMVLVESKLILEEQVTSSHQRVETVLELENEIVKYKQQLEEFATSRDVDRQKLEELADENARLEHEMKSSMNESANLENELRRAQKLDSSGVGDSLSDQLRETANNRMLRLELDNQRLSKQLEDLHDKAVLENGSRQLELEKENQRLAKKVTSLQEATAKEADKSQWLEEQTVLLSRDKENMRRTIETIRESNERQVQELTSEKEQLLHNIDTLRERGEKTQDLRYRDMEIENRRLQDSVRELSAKISRLDFDNRHLKTSQSRLTASVERLKDIEEEKSTVDREFSDLQKSVTVLEMASDKNELLEQNVQELEIENHKLTKTVENLQKSFVKLEELEGDNLKLTVENQKLQRTLQSAKTSSTKLLDAEQEKDGLYKDVQTLKRALESQKLDQNKNQQLELDLNDLDAENKKLQKNIQTLNRKIDEVQFENSEVDSENKKLAQSIESLKASLKKFNEMERDNRELDTENQNLHRENVQLEKENKRLRETVNNKDLVIDDNTGRLSELERESKLLRKTVDKTADAASKLREVEKENKDMLQQIGVDKRTLSTLREDLINEKLRSQQLSNELEKLSQELEKIGLNKDKLVATQQEQGENRYKALESMMEQAYTKTLEIKEEKINSLQSRLEESMSRNQKLQSELKLMKRKYESLKQQLEEDGNVIDDYPDGAVVHHIKHEGKPSRVVTEVNLKTAHNNPTREILSIQERLVDVERTNATLTTENKILKLQTADTSKRINTLETQNNNLHSEVSNYQKQYNCVQMENAKLQVETSTLHSHITAIEGQMSSIKQQYANLESDHEQLVCGHDELQAAHEALVTDHEQLQNIHEQLTSEYESLISEHGSLKSLHKVLKVEFRDLEAKLQKVNREKEGMGLLQSTLDKDRDNLRKEAMGLGGLQADFMNLKDENTRIRLSHDKLSYEYGDVLAEYKSTKNDYNNIQVKYTRLQEDFEECQEQLNSVDVEITKMANKVEALQILNCQLEEENRDLMLQLQALLSQNQDLLTQALANKEQYHEEELAYVEKLSNLKRQKEKLEEKIMDQYKRYDASPKKKGFGANLVRKAKGLITRKERSRDRRSSTPLSLDTSQDNADTSSLVIDSRMRNEDGPESRDEPRGRMLSRQGKSSSTTGINLLSQPATEDGTFKLRGFKSSDNLLSKCDSPRSERKGDIDSASSGTISNSKVKSTGTDSSTKDGSTKDRLSQRSNSTDSSDPNSTLNRKLMPGSMSVFDRPSEGSPRDGSTVAKLTLTEFLDETDHVTSPSEHVFSLREHVISPRDQRRKSGDLLDGSLLSRDSRTSLTSSDGKVSMDRSLSSPKPRYIESDKLSLQSSSIHSTSPRPGELQSVFNSTLQSSVSCTQNSVFNSTHQSSVDSTQNSVNKCTQMFGVNASNQSSSSSVNDGVNASVNGNMNYYSSPSSGYYSVNGVNAGQVNYTNSPGVNSPGVNSPAVNTPPKSVFADVSISSNAPSPFTKTFASVKPPVSGPSNPRTSLGVNAGSTTPVSSHHSGTSNQSGTSTQSGTVSQSPDTNWSYTNSPNTQNESYNQTVSAPAIRNYRHPPRPASTIPDVIRDSDVTRTSTPTGKEYPDPPPIRRRRRVDNEDQTNDDGPSRSTSTSAVQLVRHPHSQDRPPRSHDRHSRLQPERPATVASQPIRRVAQSDVTANEPIRRVSYDVTANEPMRPSSRNDITPDRRKSTGQTLEYNESGDMIGSHHHRHYHTERTGPSRSGGSQTGSVVSLGSSQGHYDVVRRRQRPVTIHGDDDRRRDSRGDDDRRRDSRGDDDRRRDSRGDDDRRRDSRGDSDSRRSIDSGIIMRQSAGGAPPLPARNRRHGSNPTLLDDTNVPRRVRQTTTLPARPKSVMASLAMSTGGSSTDTVHGAEPTHPPRATVKPYPGTMVARSNSQDLVKADKPTTPNGPPPKKPVCFDADLDSHVQPRARPRSRSRRQSNTPSLI